MQSKLAESKECRFIFASPETVSENPQFKELIQKRGKDVKGVIFDEAHCLSKWGKTFQPDYRSLGELRTLLFPNTMFYATSATMPPEVYDDVRAVLGFKKESLVTFRIDTDRPNIRFARRTLRFKQDSYEDLDFLVPSQIASAADIPLTLVYFDSVREAELGTKHLWTRLPPELNKWDNVWNVPGGSHVIAWFTSPMS